LRIATGRVRNTRNLALETDGHGQRATGIRTHPAMGTSTADIYAAGTCTDQPPFVYAAAAAGPRAAISMADGSSLTIECEPRALVEFDICGFIRLVGEAASGRRLGVQAIAQEARELIQVTALAIHNRLTVGDLSSQSFFCSGRWSKE
jgi:mercuric reductase